MAIDLIGSPLESLRETTFDTIVVGGGSAGLTAARTLAEGGQRVAVVEAGPAPFLTHVSNTELRFSEALMREATSQVGFAPARLSDGGSFRDSFSCLGGRGLFWNGSAPRFPVHDFAGWPLGLADLEESYDWAERAFRVTDALGRTALASRLIAKLTESGFAARPGPFAVDLDELGNGHLSAGIASVLAPFFRGVGAQVATGSLKLAVRCRATRILLSKGRARGVVATQAGGEHEVLAGTVVLAAGAIESIRLTALSEVPDPARRIGVGLQDHIFHRCYFEGPELYGSERRETAVVHVPSVAQGSEQWEIQAPGRRLWTMDESFEWRPQPGPEYELMIRAFAATEKRDENRIEAQQGGLGSATAHFSYSPSDDTMRQRLQSEAIRLGETLGLRLVEERLTGPGNSYHEAGGLDMGEDPASSVTDPFGRFHSVGNLLCVDAAAFPRIGATNPHLTIVAESRRKSRALLERT